MVDIHSAHFSIGRNVEGHALRAILTERVGQVLFGKDTVRIGQRGKNGPDPGFSLSCANKRDWMVHIAEGKLERIGIGWIESIVDGQVDHVVCVATVLRIVSRKGRDASLIGVRGNGAVWNFERHPDSTLARIAGPRPNHLEHPNVTRRVGEREGLSPRHVPVLIHERRHGVNRLLTRLGPLQSDVNETSIVEFAVGLRPGQCRHAPKGRLSNDEAVLVAVAHDIVGCFGITSDRSEILARVPLVNGPLGWFDGRRIVVEGTQEGRRVGIVGNVRRSVLRGAGSDQNVGAGRGWGTG